MSALKLEKKIALVGNPNCGKTTMFNELTGSKQYVGNWPGVTVEKKEGRLKGHEDVIITDLPGIYSLSPYTLEEVISRNYLLDNKVDAVLNLVDGSNIERNLYLTTQLMEMGIPVTIAMNMMDIVREKGDKLDLARLGKELGCHIIETSALNGEGTREAAEQAMKDASGKAPQYLHFSAEVEQALTKIAKLVGPKISGASERWLTVKLFERDSKIMGALNLTEAEAQELDKIVKACEEALGDDCESIITDERYNYIVGLMQKCVVKAQQGATMSDKIDSILTNRFLALPIFAMIMFLVYYIAVDSLGTIVTDFTNDTLFGEWIQPWVQEQLEAAGTEDWLVSLVVDGIIGGVAAPIGFAPQMAIVFLLLSFLEDCGYMARVAFIMDRIFRQFGMNGKSFIPLLISSGCGVPGIMASRTIENERDRRLTIMTTTFIPCSAKLPVIALLSGAIMGGDWYMAPIMYFIGFFAVVTSCIILKKSELFAGESAPFVMEMPPYHLPTAKNVLLHTWERVAGFLMKAGTVILLCCVAMWFLASYGYVDGTLTMVEETEQSFIAIIGGALAPLFAPLGFDSWQAVAAAFSGFVAKEAIVSTMAILAGLAEATEEEPDLWNAVMAMFPSAVAAFSFLVFNLMDSPCLAAISTMSQEMNSRKWTIATILFQNLYAYSICLMIYQLGRVFIGGEAFNAGTAVAVVMLVGFIYLLVRPAQKCENAQNVLSVNA
ncbi:MAG: ferrous iron transport protein B [Phascolarctobacterium sp.]|nr:ferrous iron transport protein B [Phascolarctobacterium sp.]